LRVRSSSIASVKTMQIPQELVNSLSSAPADMQAFAALWRGQTSLLAELPERFGHALESILQRLESGAGFAEESCSFSQRDLLDALQSWLDRAALELAKDQRSSP
jgi:hypothetical protein